MLSKLQLDADTNMMVHELKTSQDTNLSLSAEDQQAIADGMKIFKKTDFDLEPESTAHGESRLYRAKMKTTGQYVVMKKFVGQDSHKNHQEFLRLMGELIHPHILLPVGTSPSKSKAPFVLFETGHQLVPIVDVNEDEPTYDEDRLLLIEKSVTFTALEIMDYLESEGMGYTDISQSLVFMKGGSTPVIILDAKGDERDYHLFMARVHTFAMKYHTVMADYHLVMMRWHSDMANWHNAMAEALSAESTEFPIMPLALGLEPREELIPMVDIFERMERSLERVLSLTDSKHKPTIEEVPTEESDQD